MVTFDNIMQINRASSRIIEIRFKTGRKLNNPTITNFYAPHMGYAEDVIGKYRKDLNTHG